jgi:hypothetical protein
MQKPQGYKVKGKENLLCSLKKNLYGLKQAPRKWYLKFDRFMTEQGYSRCHCDCWVTKVPYFYQPFTSLSIHFHFTLNHISLSHTLTLNHFHDYMGFRNIIFQCIYFSVFE